MNTITSKLVAIIAMIGVVAAILSSRAASLTAGPGEVLIAWSYPTNAIDSNNVFRVHASTNIDLPLDAWPIAVTVPGNQLVAAVRTNFTRTFYYVTISNGFGVSVPSNVGAVPQLPVSDLKLSL